MGIICGKCDHVISDIGRDNEGLIFPDPDNVTDTFGKNIQFYECNKCGAITLFWRVWPDGVEKYLVYEPVNKKYNEITFISPYEFYTD